jgi:hypothetical protein
LDLHVNLTTHIELPIAKIILAHNINVSNAAIPLILNGIALSTFVKLAIKWHLDKHLEHVEGECMMMETLQENVEKHVIHSSSYLKDFLHHISYSLLLIPIIMPSLALNLCERAAASLVKRYGYFTQGCGHPSCKGIFNFM